MLVVARGQSISVDNPALLEYFIVNGVLTDAFSLEFVVETVPSDGTAGSQVFPATGTQVVDLVADRLGVGRYVPVWTVPSGQPVGRYKIVWTWVVEDGDEPVFLDTHFEVLTSIVAKGPLYASVASMRYEGVPATVPDHVLHYKLVGASKQFEVYTARSFEPIYKQVRIDGINKNDLLLLEPIIGIEGVHIYGGTFTSNADVDLQELRIYNRHITQNLQEPDDRESPKISFARSDDWHDPELSLEWRRFPRGTQNVRVSGVFGYTDYDGTATGTVPWMVQHAVSLIAIKDMPLLTDFDAREEARNRWAITGERTRDQQYTKFSGVDAASRSAVIGSITGDPEIDRIIALYKRGPRLGAA